MAPSTVVLVDDALVHALLSADVFLAALLVSVVELFVLAGLEVATFRRVVSVLDVATPTTVVQAVAALTRAALVTSIWNHLMAANSI